MLLIGIHFLDAVVSVLLKWITGDSCNRHYASCG